MIMTLNQQALSKAIAKVLADVETLLPADIEGWDAQLTQDIAAAKQAQTEKATGIEITNDGFDLVIAIGSEIGNAKLVKLATDLKSTVVDVETGKFLPAITSLVTDYKDARSLVGK